MKLWMDGEIIDDEDALVNVATHALHYGSGVFEGIRAYATPRGPGVFRLDDHLKRLEHSASVYRMDIGHTRQELASAIHDLIAINGLESAYVRPLVFRGAKVLGVDPSACPVQTVLMTLQWGSYLGDDALRFGVKATMSPYRRFSNDMMPSHAKASGQYLNSILAKLDSKERGFEEAILLNEQGYVSEGTGENIFVVKDGRVTTPRLEDSILPGITRQTVLEMMAHLGIEYSQEAITRDQLFAADEVFLTGTAAEITPVASIDDFAIIARRCAMCDGTGIVATAECVQCDGSGRGTAGPITAAVQKLFFDTVHGENTAFSHLLEYRA